MVLKHVEIIYHIVLELDVNFSVSGKKRYLTFIQSFLVLADALFAYTTLF